MSKKVYLAGSIEWAGSYGKEWRDNVKPQLEALGYEGFHPYETELPILQKYGYQSNAEFAAAKVNNLDNYRKCMKEIEFYDITHLALADIILVYLDGTFSAGTAGELTLALDMMKPIIAVINWDELKDIPGWCLGACTELHSNFSDALKRIDIILSNKKE